MQGLEVRGQWTGNVEDNTGLLVTLYWASINMGAKYKSRCDSEMARAHLQLQADIGVILYRRLVRRGVAAHMEEE